MLKCAFPIIASVVFFANIANADTIPSTASTPAPVPSAACAPATADTAKPPVSVAPTAIASKLPVDTHYFIQTMVLPDRITRISVEGTKGVKRVDVKIFRHNGEEVTVLTMTIKDGKGSGRANLSTGTYDAQVFVDGRESGHRSFLVTR